MLLRANSGMNNVGMNNVISGTERATTPGIRPWSAINRHLIPVVAAETYRRGEGGGNGGGITALRAWDGQEKMGEK